MRPLREIGPLLPFTWENIDTGERESYEVSFEGADVSVKVTLNVQVEDENISRYRNTAMELARTALNVVCFLEGVGLVLYLDRYISPEGEEQLLVPGDPRLKSLVSLTNINMPVICSLLVEDQQLSRPLSDLVSAVTWPHAAPINCARAIEALRRHMNPNEGEDRGRSWGIFQNKLNITKSYREFVTKISTNPRHGDSSFIDSDSQEECIVREWTIMDRYFRYLVEGKKPLDTLPLL